MNINTESVPKLNLVLPAGHRQPLKISLREKPGRESKWSCQREPFSYAFFQHSLSTSKIHTQSRYMKQAFLLSFATRSCLSVSCITNVSASGSKAASVDEVGVYVDLAYIPSGSSSPTVTVDFFRCIRSSCYIISGNSPEQEELMRQTLDALLDGKTSWPDSMQV